MVRKKVTEIVAMLISRENVRWKMTKTDLIEMVHIAYLEAEIMEPGGQVAHFSYLLREAFRAINQSMPANPNKHVKRAAQKQGINSISMEQRVYNMMFVREEEIVSIIMD